MKMAIKGLHIVAELHGCPASKLKKASEIKKVLNEAVKKSKLKKINEAYHQFSPHGTTGFVLLETSHISIHTWPEDNYVAVDLFTCGSRTQGRKAIQVVKDMLKPKHVEKREILRGQ